MFSGRILKMFTAGSLMLGLGACADINDLTESQYRAEFSMITSQNRALREVPAPQRRVTASVYDFPDLTGQLAIHPRPYHTAHQNHGLSQLTLSQGEPQMASHGL